MGHTVARPTLQVGTPRFSEGPENTSDGADLQEFLWWALRPEGPPYAGVRREFPSTGPGRRYRMEQPCMSLAGVVRANLAEPNVSRIAVRPR